MLKHKSGDRFTLVIINCHKKEMILNVIPLTNYYCSPQVTFSPLLVRYNSDCLGRPPAHQIKWVSVPAPQGLELVPTSPQVTVKSLKTRQLCHQCLRILPDTVTSV